MGCSVSPIVITGESHGVERLSRSCVVEWMCRTYSGIQALALLSDLGVEAKVARLGRSKCLLEFGCDKDLLKVLQLDGSWWAS
ncbi:hypothetical protein Dimus_034259 [Dionaea muscipula]